MTINANILFSVVRKGTLSLVAGLALVAVWSPSWAAESGQPAGPAPGGLEIPPLMDGQQTPPQPQGQAQPHEQKTQTPPPRKDAPREDIISGTGQSFGGYNGTWHDPERDETVTTIIAPRQPMTQQPPMYIAPQVYPDWGGNWSQGGGQYYPPQWNPGYRPQRPPHWDQNNRPNRPPRPPYWNPGQRPPHWDNDYRPNRPPRPPYWLSLIHI